MLIRGVYRVGERTECVWSLESYMRGMKGMLTPEDSGHTWRYRFLARDMEEAEALLEECFRLHLEKKKVWEQRSSKVDVCPPPTIELPDKASSSRAAVPSSREL